MLQRKPNQNVFRDLFIFKIKLNLILTFTILVAGETLPGY